MINKEKVKEVYNKTSCNHALFLYNILNKKDNCVSERLATLYDKVINILSQWYFVDEKQFSVDKSYVEYLNLKSVILELEDQISLNLSREYTTRQQLNEDIYGES